MGVLDDSTVIDLSVLVQGPQAASTLHDFGATVIKIELPDTGDLARGIPISPDDHRLPYFEANNRGKRSVAVDLRRPSGKQILEKLVESADVLIHNFVPGTMETWGLSYEHLSAINPRLIYATGSSFGTEGPNATREGADMVGQAEGGLMFTTQIAGGPPTMIGAVIADHTGAQNMVAGVLGALLHRERTGRGQRVDVSLVGSMIYAQASELTYTLLCGDNPTRPGPNHPIISGLVQPVASSDGWIQLLGSPPHLWDDFARAIGREDLIDDPRFKTRPILDEHLGDLRKIVEACFITRTTAEWEQRLAEFGQRFGVVRTYEEIQRNEDALANGYLRRVVHPERGETTIIGTPIRMSETPLEPGIVAPELGQHTEEVLLELGYSWADIESFRADGSVG